MHFDAPACQLVCHQRGSTGLLEPQLGVRVQVVPEFLQLAVVFADSVDEIEQVPGIGRSSAAAIAACAFGRRAAILDGNVKRVLARCYGVEGWPGEREVEAKLWRLAERLLPKEDVGVYTQALMD